MANERMNLMNMAKLSIKGLIESALNLGRTLDSDYAPLQQFFVVMEHCLKHGLKGNLACHSVGAEKSNLVFKVWFCNLPRLKRGCRVTVVIAVDLTGHRKKKIHLPEV